MQIGLVCLKPNLCRLERYFIDCERNMYLFQVMVTGQQKYIFLYYLNLNYLKIRSQAVSKSSVNKCLPLWSQNKKLEEKCQIYIQFFANFPMSLKNHSPRILENIIKTFNFSCRNINGYKSKKLLPSTIILGWRQNQ